MIPENFIFLAALINLAATVPYVWGTLQGRTKPNRVTWLIWAVAPLLAAAAQLSHGVGWSTLMVFMNGFSSLLVFLASFANRNAYWKLSSLDYACGALSLIGLLLWWTTQNPVHAVIFGILADLLAAIPTIIKSYKSPETEDGRTFAIALFAVAMACLTITQNSFIAYAFTVYVMGMNSLLTLLIYRKNPLSLLKGKSYGIS